jgi:hypothetical protein
VDIFRLYDDYLSTRGYHAVNRYLSADSILDDIEKETPDILLNRL